MLARLYVKNIALIQEADIKFNKAFNVLSGETGSGKSIILDSVNFVLGSKADKSLIRYGENEAFVKAEFMIDADCTACKILDDMDIECDDSIVISRKFSIDGKGSIKINGNTVTASMLKKVTQHLVDVHGQSEHFFLLNEDNQLQVIDNLCGESVKKLKSRLSELISAKRAYKNQIAELGGNEQERERNLDLLSYQISEIEKADIKVGELDELRERKKLIDNSEKILTTLSAVKEILSSDNGCNDLLALAARHSGSISDLNSDYLDIYSRIDNLYVEAQDLSDTVSDMIDESSFDEGEAQYVGERISIIKGLIKKYGADEQEVLDFLENAKEKYDSLVNSAALLEKLNKSIADCDDKIFSLCNELTLIRKNKCSEFSKNIIAQLKSLNIPHASFEVQFEEYDKHSANLDSANGADKICFMFSANKGEPVKPLSKVISGGEMSRFMLAIKSQLKDLNGISTYIFDEIDAGISGVTARTVAEKFINISKDTQIIAVSHLPQVCAAASSQYLIYKTENDEKTVTNVKCLSNQERVEEIVRLTGGANTSAAVTHAEELLKSFNKR